MALIDKFSKYLIDEHIEKEEKKKQEGMPKELGFSVDRVQIAQPIANIVNEFMAMLPHSEWKCFPSNDIPSIEYSDKHSIYTNSHFESYGQIQLDNTNLKSLYMGYDNFTCYYVFTGNTYYWRKGAKYVNSVIQKTLAISMVMKTAKSGHIKKRLPMRIPLIIYDYIMRTFRIHTANS